MQIHGRTVGLDQPIFLIAGPCVIESEELQLRTAERLKAIADRLGILFFYKSSFDQANVLGTIRRAPRFTRAAVRFGNAIERRRIRASAS